MILKGKHHFLLDPFFRFYVIKKMHRNFHSIKITGTITDKKFPVMLICNHMSWWDGIWALHVNQTLFGRKYFFMMLEDQLRKNWFLKYTGGFSISKNSKSIMETITYTSELLKDKKNLVLLFPQGEIGSMHEREFKFKKGIERILQGIGNDVQVVFLASIIDYHSNVKPTVYSFVEDFTGRYRVEEIQECYNRFYRACISEQLKLKS